MESLIGGLLKAVGSLIHIGIMIYIWCIIIRAIISWVNPDPYNPAVRFLYQITDPVFFRIRQWLPLNIGGIDFSPIVLIFGLYFIDDVCSNLFDGLSAALLGHQTFHGTHIFAYLLKALAGVSHSIIWILMILIIGRIILSFVNPDPYNMIVQFIYKATDPPIYF
jgi:Predicted integral membrane protein